LDIRNNYHTDSKLQLIKGAVTSSIGIIDNALAPLGRQTGTQAIDDLVQHLTNNTILLIIDNLETVVDHNLRYLASNMPNSGSKILSTSRRSLGAFYFPNPVTPAKQERRGFIFPCHCESIQRKRFGYSVKRSN
jgi:LuxR family transcriptional regulator, glucitol operon activator